MEERPLLFLDVDGPLYPCTRRYFGFLHAEEYRQITWADANGFKRYPTYPSFWIEAHRRLKKRTIPSLDVWLAGWHGRFLRKMVDAGVELVWATSWFQEANRWIAPILGLGSSVPVLWYEDDGFGGTSTLNDGMIIHRQTPLPIIEPLLAYTVGRPFLWVSSDIANVDYHYLMDRVDVDRFHLVKPYAHDGLTLLDTELIEFWLSKFTGRMDHGSQDQQAQCDEHR